MTEKTIAQSMPMRVLDEKQVPCTPRQQAGKQFAAEGVASDLGVPVTHFTRWKL